MDTEYQRPVTTKSNMAVFSYALVLFKIKANEVIKISKQYFIVMCRKLGSYL